MPTEPASAKSRGSTGLSFRRTHWIVIAGIAPRSSLIVTDEALSSEDRQRHGFRGPHERRAAKVASKMRRREPGAEFILRALTRSPVRWGERCSGVLFPSW